MKILVAEDDLDNARLLESILKKNAHTVELVGDGKEALKRMREERFDALPDPLDDAGNGWGDSYPKGPG